MAQADEVATPLRLPARAATAPALSGFVLVVVALGCMRLAVGRGLPGVADMMIMTVATLAPLIAAVIVACATMGLDGLRDLRGRVGHWRIRPAWYFLGVGVPVAAYGAVFAVYIVTIGTRPDFQSGLLLVVAEIVAVGFVLFLVEEIGWRGWLQRALQARMSGLGAALTVGVVWAAWHMPLLAVRDTMQAELSIVVFVPLVLAVSVVFAWIYNATGGSVLAVVAAHTGFNLGVGPAATALPGAVNTFIALCAALTAVTATALVVATGLHLGLRSGGARKDQQRPMQPGRTDLNVISEPAHRQDGRRAPRSTGGVYEAMRQRRARGTTKSRW